ncbi:MAG: NUDIX domain-containing protein [Myxococcota bacterium]
MSALSHAGGIVFRDSGGRREYLLVRSRNALRHWVFPKGHIEAGESPEQTAEREVREEAGARVELVAPVGESQFDRPVERVHVRYFSMRYQGPCAADEERDTRWCSYEQALACLSFEEDRRLLHRLHESST